MDSRLRLLSGEAMPRIGLGTFGSDRYDAVTVARAVRVAAEIGFRHFDLAAVYGNEREVGAALRGSGVPREAMWVTGKLWNSRHDDPERACEESLRDSGLHAYDLYLVHWPFPNHHAPGVDGGARDPRAVPYRHEAYMEVWRGMERLVERGLARHIGTSNMTIRKLEGVLREAAILPAANEMEMHPHFQQPALFDFLRSRDVLPIAYSPLGSPGRPERDRSPEDARDLDDPAILRIAARRGVSPAAAILGWAATRGAVPIPFSVKRPQMEEALEAVRGAPLTPDEMARFAELDRGNRLIKGQVFLWPDAKDWRDLWDDEASERPDR